MKTLNLLFSDTKEFLANEMNRVLIAVIILGTVLLLQQHKLDLQMQELETKMLESVQISSNETLEAVKKSEKKTDFRYFNLTRSLEDIHKVKINTKNGRLEK